MESYELKFKKKDLYALVGGLWALVSIINLVLLVSLIFVFQPSFMIGSIILVMELLIIIIIGLILSKYYINLPKRTYIKICQNELEIHKGLFRRNRIDFGSVEEVRLLGNKMSLILMGNQMREFEIKLALVYQKDLDLLLERFTSLNITVSRI